jgi:hypothetical protein
VLKLTEYNANHSLGIYNELLIERIESRKLDSNIAGYITVDGSSYRLTKLDVLIFNAAIDIAIQAIRG